jgi:hypothetical protein
MTALVVLIDCGTFLNDKLRSECNCILCKLIKILLHPFNDTSMHCPDFQIDTDYFFGIVLFCDSRISPLKDSEKELIEVSPIKTK